MPTNELAFLTFACAAFVGFGVVLAWMYVDYKSWKQAAR